MHTCLRSFIRSVGIPAVLALSACGGGGGGGGGGDPNIWYHFICNGDSECLSTNFAGAPSGSSNQGPGAGGQAGCNGLMNFGNINWNIPPAQQWCDTTSNLSDAPFPTVTISVSPNPITQGQSATVTWSSTKATSCTAGGAWTGSKGLSGSQMVTQSNTGSYQYRLTCTNGSGSATNTATLTVNVAPPGVQLSVSPATITLGQSATLSWISYQYTACTASGPWSGSKALNGSEMVTPAAAGHFAYTLGCQGAGKGSGSASATLTVNPTSGSPPAAPTVSLNASPAYPSCIDTGASDTLTWSSTNTTACTASGAWNGDVATSGNQLVYPGASSPTANTIHEYALNCSGPGGTASASVKVCAVPPNGGSWPPVTLSFTVTPASVSLGESATLQWTSTNAAYCAAADDWSGAQSLSGTKIFTPSTARGYLFTLTCQNYLSASQKQVQLGVTPAAGSVATARFCQPQGLAMDSSDTLYVADSGNHTIRKITAAGVVSTVAGQADSQGSADGIGAAARFSFPYGLGAGPGGTFLVADANNHTIRKLAADGTVTTLAGSVGAPGHVDATGAGASFWQPNTVSVDAAGNGFVADYGNCLLRKVAPDGVVTTFAGVFGECSATDGASGTARIGGIKGLIVLPSGDIYTPDNAFDVIRKIDAAGTVTTIAGTSGVEGSTDATGAAARFKNPISVAADSSGNLYVTDNGNFSIRKVTQAGVATTLAGSGSSAVVNGTGSGASFVNPAGIAVDSAGNVFVTDAYAIRKITSAGVVTTYAGEAFTCGSNN